MTDEESKLLEAMNASGFLFQLRVENEIRFPSDTKRHSWHVTGHEYRWRDSESGRNGYIDIVIENDSDQRMVIECKRFKDTAWIFLQMDSRQADSRQIISSARLHWCHSQKEKNYLAGWDDFILPQSFQQSEFCIQVKKNNLLLEDIAAELLQSIECLAEEEGQLRQSRKGNGYIYLPLIVTNVPLYLCNFDTPSINLETGFLRGDQADFKEVQYIAFKKSLTTRLTSTDQNTRLRNQQDPTLGSLNQENQRTVFVVNVKYLIDFLCNIGSFYHSRFSEWPWNVARQIEQELQGT